MSRYFFLFLFAACCVLPAGAQQAVVLSQQPLSRWDVGTANFSGIAPLGGNRYVLVSDKEPEDGFFIVRIDQHPSTGKVAAMYLESFQGSEPKGKDRDGNSLRDTEGIAFMPSGQTVWLSGEGDQQIVEHALDGRLTGRSLNVPPLFELSNIYENRGFEALTYDASSRLFWTTTETTLRSDGIPSGPQNPGAANFLRLQSFGLDLLPSAQYAYRMEAGRTEFFGRSYIHGVPSLCALPDGRLIVMEREGLFTEDYVGSLCTIKLFVVNPKAGIPIDSGERPEWLSPERFLPKTHLATWTTRLIVVQNNLANYEGMCLGARLDDGRQTLLCINDSQASLGKGMLHLQDYIRVVVLPHGF